MTLEARTRAAQFRQHRRLGQLCRSAHAEIRAMADRAQRELESAYTLIVSDVEARALERRLALIDERMPRYMKWRKQNPNWKLVSPMFKDGT